MATAHYPEDNTLSCSICYDGDAPRRKLPVCLHSFCETCILTFVKRNENVLAELQCPVCRQINSGPECVSEIQDWLLSLELESSQIRKYEKGKEGMEPCARCKDPDTPVQAIRYCFDCQEFLCETCCRIGHGFKQIKSHLIADMQENLCDTKTREVIQSMSDYLVCKVHPEKELSLLCREDNILFCESCAEICHKSCTDIVTIKECASTEIVDREAEILLKRFSAITEISQAIIQRKKENEEELKKDTENIVAEIQQMRRKINDVFDVLEDSVYQQCKALSKTYSLADQDDVSKLQETIQSLDVSRTLLSKAFVIAPKNLAFIILHELKKLTEKHETTVLEFHHSCTSYAMELDFNDMLEKLQNVDLNEACAMVEVTGNETGVILPKYPSRRLLRLCDIEKNGEHQIKPQNVESPLYSGMALLPDNSMVLTDWISGNCCLINPQYGLIDVLDFNTIADNNYMKRHPRSASYIKGSIVAISLPEEKKIYFVSADGKLKVIGDICTEYAPFAIRAIRNGDLAIAWNSPVAFGIVSFSSSFGFTEKIYFNHDKAGRILKSFMYMAVDEERAHVIQPCKIDKAVYCFDFAGNPKFTYTHSELGQPLGVAIDNDGSIYICDQDRHCIHVVSSAGRPSRIIKSGCPEYPTALAYKRNCYELVVANGGLTRFRSVCVFRIKT